MKGFIKRLLRENLITEKDNRVVLKTKLKLSDKLADELHALSDKYSIWFGNHLKGYEKVIIDEFGSRVTNDKLIEIIDKKLLESFNLEKQDYQKILSLFKTDNKPKTDINKLDYNGALNLYNIYSQSIKDWLAGDGNPNIRNITWDEAGDLATNWHNNLSVGGELSSDIMDGKDDIIHKFDDGFMWVVHTDNECKSSEKSMGHCGRASEYGMYLLRLIKGNEEFVTGDWDPDEKYIIQLKGKGNNKPHEKYHKYILWLLLDWGNIDELKTNEGYKPDTNFHLSDLSLEDYNRVLSKAPELMNKAEVEKYFYNIYDEHKGDDKFFKLRDVISQLISNDEFMSKITFAWVKQIIRFSKDEKVNLVNTFIDKLIDNEYFKNGFKEYYDFEYVIKNYNNPVKFLMNYNVSRLIEHIIIDDYNQNLLNEIDYKNIDGVLDYLVSIEAIGKESDVYEVFLKNAKTQEEKDKLIDKFLYYYTKSGRKNSGIESKWVCGPMLINSSKPQVIYAALGKETFDAIWEDASDATIKQHVDKSNNPNEVYRLLKSAKQVTELTESIKKKLKL